MEIPYFSSLSGRSRDSMKTHLIFFSNERLSDVRFELTDSLTYPYTEQELNFCEIHVQSVQHLSNEFLLF